jgi:DNA-binding NtrC family response regulator
VDDKETALSGGSRAGGTSLGPAGMIGASPAMRALFAGIERVARSDVVVHLYGETGTGKERVARAIHEASSRARRAFVALNAAAMSDELFHSEMFGHARGAFTGAVSARDGLVAAAEGGTLFLDEVVELTPKAQSRLLRFVERREYHRLGETHMRRADVRVLTAANVVLDECVARGLFRADLLYRLKVVVLCLPPLRERGHDVLLLARSFLRRFAAEAGVPCLELSPEMEKTLLRGAWPGNVRELENAMERLVTFGVGGEGPQPGQASPRFVTDVPRPVALLKEAREEFDRSYLREALALYDGNRTRTAAALGLSRQGLGLLLGRLGMSSAHPLFVSRRKKTL